jgi:hypothetical protein
MKMKNKASCCCEKKKSNLFGGEANLPKPLFEQQQKRDRMGGHYKEGKGKERKRLASSGRSRVAG